MAKEHTKPTHMTLGSVLDELDLTPDEIAEARIKADLWRDLVGHVRSMALPQRELAVRLGVHQPDVSNLLTGKLSKFSVEMLIRYAVRLGLGFEGRFTAPGTKGTRISASATKAKRPRRSMTVLLPVAG